MVFPGRTLFLMNSLDDIPGPGASRAGSYRRIARCPPPGRGSCTSRYIPKRYPRRRAPGASAHSEHLLQPRSIVRVPQDVVLSSSMPVPWPCRMAWRFRGAAGWFSYGTELSSKPSYLMASAMFREPVLTRERSVLQEPDPVAASARRRIGPRPKTGQERLTWKRLPRTTRSPNLMGSR